MSSDLIKICLSIGYPMKHSLSPLMHNAGFKSLKIDDQFIYLPAEVEAKDLNMAIDGIRALRVRGVSITMPHKLEIMKYLDVIDEQAKKIGAVNTVVNDNGKLNGYNADSIGAMRALEKKTLLKGKKVAVIGAGGAARAIVYGLTKNRVLVKIFNRSIDKAEELAKEFSYQFGSLTMLREISEFDILINATSVGMNEGKSPIEKKYLNKNQVVFDIVYSPKETKLIKDAKEKGAQVIPGYEMLLYQGVEQFKMYTGLDAPVEVMRAVLEKNLK